MGYKELLNTNKMPYLDTDRFTHMKDDILSERYYSNYIDYKLVPNIEELAKDIDYIKEEQINYPHKYIMFNFPENYYPDLEIKEYLEKEGFKFSRHIIFTNQFSNLKLSQKDIGSITIEELHASDFSDYLDLKYQQSLVYGEDFAKQMLVYNRMHLPEKGSRIYVAKDGKKLVGDVTAWEYGEYIEIDDFSLIEDYRGKGIGSALQRTAAQYFKKLILVSEEENRDMYEHQGYQEAAYYWNALKSDNPSFSEN
ncbi:MAG: GNAT family N-acetyltransferase [Streptococcus parauberis]|uniref:GNAT family N-acetyltransferase n=1 Tax=Streptococcus parauberis TaxID=1348 RepID=UPI000CCDFD96|nr:GNAT family N-acetyltransferase [Streptococcus parauberis]PNY22285.1 Acetyltransferase (GNAT) family protein [Streptococcus parauberis]